MSRKPTPAQIREVMHELGSRGGGRNTKKQIKARSANLEAARKAKALLHKQRKEMRPL